MIILMVDEREKLLGKKPDLACDFSCFVRKCMQASFPGFYATRQCTIFTHSDLSTFITCKSTVAGETKHQPRSSQPYLECSLDNSQRDNDNTPPTLD